MKITVLGSTGRTGLPFVDRALAAGHDAVALARSPEKLGDRRDHERLTVVAGDATDPATVEEAVAGADAVVSLLGHADGAPDDLLTVAGDHVVAAMRDHGVERYVTLAGAGVRSDRDPGRSLGGRAVGAGLKLFAGDLLEDSREHVDRVVDTDLDWTVVRPPRLTEGPYTGDWEAGYLRMGMGDAISRADLAAFVLTCVEGDEWVRELPMVTGR
ncbi:NAD(P)-dependent oxidoreductase [Halobaculum litoreum]|uniref:NAD(P)-dependent oxidoreductase n=1 Tax=Halobaculum litoreum TaxID=3031998 RepID=A0ABD5XSJ2_9EURY